MKKKSKLFKRASVKQWIENCNIFARSLIAENDALKEFNSMLPAERIAVQKLFKQYDEIRRKKLPKGESDSAWLDCVLADANIIATECNIDPLTAVMCIRPICKANETIYCTK